MTTFCGLMLTGLVMAGLFGMYRIYKGPTNLNRVLAVDFLSVVGIAAALILVIITGEMMILDLALCMALVGFISAYIFAKYLTSRDDG